MGHYVSVGYCNKWYRGVVEEVNDDEMLVKFMQVKGDNQLVWPGRDDKLAVPMTDILCILSKPTSFRRFYSFEKTDMCKSNLAFDKWYQQE